MRRRLWSRTGGLPSSIHHSGLGVVLPFSPPPFAHFASFLAFPHVAFVPITVRITAVASPKDQRYGSRLEKVVSNRWESRVALSHALSSSVLSLCLQCRSLLPRTLVAPPEKRPLAASGRRSSPPRPTFRAPPQTVRASRHTKKRAKAPLVQVVDTLSYAPLLGHARS